MATSHSWRGVLRQLGMTSPRAGRQLRAACDALSVPYQHFARMHGVGDDEFRAAVIGGGSWAEVLAALGYAADSGSARSSVRRRAAGLGIGLEHLQGQAAPCPQEWPFAGDGEPRHLRRAAAFLVAAKCALLGHNVSWPLEPAVYDLVVDAGARGLLRVQVKSGTRKVSGTWMVWITRGSSGSGPRAGRAAYSVEEIDYFGVVDGGQRVYMIPASVVEGRSALSLRAYEQYRLRV